ncbi:tRNA synthetases class I, catalytic domain-containing protein [Chytriomyces cf. hyalinus JEL632]|nr:tRNA synthetases class I, catalytic domain-containing protein [Chytriomyces cf. hyalinus JEL632]
MVKMGVISKITASTKPASYAVAAVAHLLKLPLSVDPLAAEPSVTGPASVTAQSATAPISLSGSIPVLRYVARVDASHAKTLGITDTLRHSQIDYWIDFCGISLAPEAGFKPLATAFNALNSHLKMRSFLVGYSLTLADIACWGALRAIPIFNQKVKAKDNGLGPYLTRWFNHVDSLDFATLAVAEFEKTKAVAPKEKKGDQGSFEINLVDAQMGKVVTRFPPEPSGYMHIGHAKAALLNEYFARKYEGTMICRFDDTNPSKEKSEFEETIMEDLVLLGIKPDRITHTSDCFDVIYEYALKLIKKGLAYVDDSTQEVMREERMALIESKCRNLSVEENLRRFSEMTRGSEKGVLMCLRAKINMKDPNGTMRDPVIYRCNATPHHRTGTKWKLYPIYDFACPIVDAHEGVTHALRSMEYRDRNPQYDWFLTALELRKVHIWDFSRVNFVYTLLSKRKLAWFVEEGLVTGWDDARFPTVRGIRRRGMTIQALRDYILMQGASQKMLELEWDKIWTLNKKVIDPIAPRHTALERVKITKVKVINADLFTPYTKSVPKHQKNPEVGEKMTTYSPELYLEFNDAKDLVVGEEVTLMAWGNVIVEKIDWAEGNDFIGTIEIRLNLDGDFKKTKKKLTWLARGIPSNEPQQAPVRATLFDFDYLITKKKLEEDDEMKDFVTPVTEFKTEAWGDANLRLCKQGDIIQLERKGYYIVDKAFDPAAPNSSIHLFLIPDGRVDSIKSKAAPEEPAAASAPVAAPAAKKAKTAKGAVAKPVASNDPLKSPMYASKKVYTETAKFPGVSGQMYEVKAFYGSPFAATKAVAPSAKAAAPAAVDAATPATEGKKEKAEKGKKDGSAAAAAPVAEEASIISKLDMVVGKIIKVENHPDADSLYVEQIDCGEAQPRTVVSGLRKFMTLEDLQDRMILVLKNLKPAAMRGIKSHAMVLCASNADHTKVEFLIPPAGSKPGDRVFFEGHEGEPEEQLNPKKKVWETVQPDFKTRDDLVAVWKNVEFRTEKGIVKTGSLAGASIK